jgi:methionyl-tRNA synthetase
MLQKSYDVGDIYQDEYDGLYCVWCEWFKKESDLIEHEWVMVCPDHLKQPQHVKENNRFFALQNYQSRLEKFYWDNELFILPQKRYNEVVSFVKGGLENFSISRQWSSFGIQIPFDEKSVSYIRYDALFNYHTVCSYPKSFTENWQSVSWNSDDTVFWDSWEIVHYLWKDIVRFHGVFWPAMLESVWLRQPDHEVVTGFFTIDWHKMSKSLGNVIDPVETIHTYWRDALVYYLFSDIVVWNDGDFSWNRFHDTTESVLKKWWWNLIARTVTLAKKIDLNCVRVSSVTDLEFIKFLEAEGVYNTWVWKAVMWKGVEHIMEYGYDWHTQMIQDWYRLIKIANKRVDLNKPWELLKTDPKKSVIILQQLIWRIKWCAIISSSFLIDWWEKVKLLLNVNHPDWIGADTSNMQTNRSTLLNLQEFDINLWEWKYIY